MAAITVTNAGLNMFRDAMKGAGSAKILYVALGTNSTAPAVGDTALGHEVFRKAVASYTNGASPGEVLINCYIAPGEMVGVDIEEIGFIGGNATNLLNTGVLLAHGLFAHNPKTNVESLQFQLDFTV